MKKKYLRTGIARLLLVIWSMVLLSFSLIHDHDHNSISHFADHSGDKQEKIVLDLESETSSCVLCEYSVNQIYSSGTGNIELASDTALMIFPSGEESNLLSELNVSFSRGPPAIG